MVDKSTWSDFNLSSCEYQGYPLDPLCMDIIIVYNITSIADCYNQVLDFESATVICYDSLSCGLIHTSVCENLRYNYIMYHFLDHCDSIHRFEFDLRKFVECLFQFKLPQEANYSSKHWKIVGAKASKIIFVTWRIYILYIEYFCLGLYLSEEPSWLWYICMQGKFNNKWFKYFIATYTYKKRLQSV